MHIFIEPSCRGETHVSVNAALLVTSLLAFPEEEITYFSEDRHFELISSLLEEFYPSELSRVHWMDLETSEFKNGRFSERFLLAVQQNRRINNFIWETDSDSIVFTSINPVEVLVLKAWPVKLSINVTCVLHTALSLAGDTSVKSRLFHALLKIRNSDSRISYVVLAPSIWKAASKALPSLSSAIEWIDHPYLFSRSRPIHVYGSTHSQGTVFGFLGSITQGKGFEEFEKLAAELTDSIGDDRKPIFRHVGSRSKGAPSDSVVLGPGIGSPMPWKEYHEWISGIHYAVFPFSSSRYAFTASGSFMDAMYNNKPVVALRTPLFEDYFKRFGDLGYLCDNYEELKETVRDLSIEIPRDLYAHHQRNIILAKDQFKPENIAIKWRKIISSRAA